MRGRWASLLSLSVYYLYFVMLKWALAPPTHPVVAIAGAASALIVVACYDGCRVSSNKGSFPPSSSSRSAWPNLIPLPSFPRSLVQLFIFLLLPPSPLLSLASRFLPI